MPPSEPVRTARQSELLEAATDYVLTHGLATLSLRPLAAALGTSDRMLLYHFASKDDLVAAIVATCSDRASHAVDELAAEPDPVAAVQSLWSLYQRPDVAAAVRVYVQAAALGLLGSEPYRSAAAASNETWAQAVRNLLARSGVGQPAPHHLKRAAGLLDAALFGLTVNQVLDDDGDEQEIIHEVAEAVSRICAG